MSARTKSLEAEIARLKVENERLERELLVLREDLEAGLASPRYMYIRLLCRCYFAIMYRWRAAYAKNEGRLNDEYLDKAISILDRIGAIRDEGGTAYDTKMPTDT